MTIHAASDPRSAAPPRVNPLYPRPGPSGGGERSARVPSPKPGPRRKAVGAVRRYAGGPHRSCFPLRTNHHAAQHPRPSGDAAPTAMKLGSSTTSRRALLVVMFPEAGRRRARSSWGLLPKAAAGKLADLPSGLLDGLVTSRMLPMIRTTAQAARRGPFRTQGPDPHGFQGRATQAPGSQPARWRQAQRSPGRTTR